MIKKIFNILNGWGKRLGILQISTAEQKLSELRMKKCTNCPFTTSSKILKLVNGNASYESTLVCTRCNCPCLEKTIVVDEKCPLEKW